MNAREVRQLQSLIASTHIESVIRVCATYCHEQAAHCERTPNLTAIAKEWTRAADLLTQAADTVEA